jgi:hypothetical protein
MLDDFSQLYRLCFFSVAICVETLLVDPIELLLYDFFEPRVQRIEVDELDVQDVD